MAESSDITKPNQNQQNNSPTPVQTSVLSPSPTPPSPELTLKANIWLGTILPSLAIVLMLGLPLGFTIYSISHTQKVVNTVPPIVQPVTPSAPSVPFPSTGPDDPKPVVKPTQTIVQIGSYRSSQEARSALKKVKNNSIFDVTQLTVYKSHLPTGDWYRLALPVDNVNIGTDICTAWKAQGGDCLVLTLNIANS